MVATDNDLPARPKGPALPISNPCLSYWQRTTRGFPHLHSNRHAPVPETAKYVVIGSGIAGALTAFKLLESGVKGEDVVVLEAREAASGASGRNAGHVRPDSFRGFVAYSRLHGITQAVKIIQNERVVLQEIDNFIREHQVPCDFHLTTTFDVCLTQEFADYEAECFEAYKQAGGDVSHVKFYAGDEARRVTRVKDAITAYEWPAGSSHPAKLAQWLLNSVVERGVRLFTHCAATAISKVEGEGDGPVLWRIQTPRGSLTSSIVIHCTNAHAPFLLPGLVDRIIPNKAQAHSLIPPPSLTAINTLQSTFSLRYSLTHFYSVIQRPGDGTIVLGVSRTNPTLSAATLAEQVSIDDSGFNEEIRDDALKHWNKLFPQEDEPGREVHGEGVDHSWSGIIAMTPDSVPYVGALEDLPGQFICAGFNGHGMARIFTSAPGVVKLVLGKDWSETGLPECFQISKSRLSKSIEPKKSVW